MITIDKGCVNVKGDIQDVIVEFLNFLRILYQNKFFIEAKKGVNPKLYKNLLSIEKTSAEISNLLEKKPQAEYKRMNLRVMETTENLQDFIKFFTELEEMGFIKIINKSINYPNRGNSTMERRYFTIEFLKS